MSISHIRTVWSYEPDRSRVLSADQQRLLTLCVCLERQRLSAGSIPGSTAQQRTVLSYEPLASSWPDGANSTVYTAPA